MIGIYVVLMLPVKTVSSRFLARVFVPLSWARVWGQMQTRLIVLASNLPETIQIRIREGWRFLLLRVIELDIVLTPEHAAALVYLPEYRDANQSLSVDGEAGWIWAEATGGNNPLGWMPEEFLGTELEVYEVDDRAITKGEPPDKSSIVITPDSGSSGIHISPFFIVIGLLFLISLLRRRR
jgi:hypothetical protein